jgi:hypothetical protein
LHPIGLNMSGLVVLGLPGIICPMQDCAKARDMLWAIAGTA